MVTALAATQGAGCWFDLPKRFVGICGVGKKTRRGKRKTSGSRLKFIARHRRKQFPVVKAGDCFGQDPRNDTGYVFDDIRYVVIASETKQSFSHKQTAPSDKG
ncbi:MAG: hypothetical protein DYG84_10785 [Candidatus Brocadia sp. AMX3]|nr:hypothetical protein [Candidatus Brocadia sp. AMX3]